MRIRSLFLRGALAAATLFVLAVAPASAAGGSLVYDKTLHGSGHPSGRLGATQGVAVDPSNGNVFVIDATNKRVEEFGPSGAFVRQFGTPTLFAPKKVAVNPTTHHVYVTDQGFQSVFEFSQGGRLVRSWGGPDVNPPTPGMFDDISSLAIDPATGDVYVGDGSNDRIEIFDQRGTYESEFTASDPSDMAFDPAGDSFYLASSAHTGGSTDVLRYTTADPTAAPQRFGPAPTDPHPYGQVPVLAVGNDGVDLEDFAHDYVRRYDSTGAWVTEVFGNFGDGPGGFGNGGVNGLAQDPRGGLYVSDPVGHRVVHFAHPRAEATDAGDVTGSTATANGVVRPDGVDVSYQVLYRRASLSAYHATPVVDIPGDLDAHDVNVPLDGLRANTEYVYKLRVTAGPDTFVSNPVHFTTGGSRPAESDLSDIQVTGIDSTQATVSATVATHGAGVAAYVYYSADNFDHYQFARLTSSEPVRAAERHVSATLTGLEPGTTYIYEVGLTNADGSAFTNILTFTTDPPPED